MFSMPIPSSVTATRLFRSIESDANFVQTIACIREVAEALGRQIERLLPEFTDHSARHMDHLWSVADTLLKPNETERLTHQEIFLLGCTFYVHDLGMAIASTPEGIERLRATEEYKSAYEKLARARFTQDRAHISALRSASRQLHAANAVALATEIIPGVGRYLIENTDMREKWGSSIGDLAASHHWTLSQVDERLGRRGVVPTVDAGCADLGYIACLLRIADFAHINRDRAPTLDRLLRAEVNDDSTLHWDAQANVTGPTRDGDQLVYGCTEALTSIDAWWLFYDMASGLDVEVRTVHDYLTGRKVSDGRFTLQGVRGVESPEAFSSYLLLDSDIAPIDIRVMPHSMERVVDLLGGPALYRGDSLAPIRELIQNSRDAIALRNAIEAADGEELTRGKIEITVDLTADPPLLRLRDNGIGMTRTVVKNHLIAVASDFWDSVEFARDFSRARAAGFRPVGRFGIGFLSVFMLGRNVEVETERIGSRRVLLKLRGIARRGELREKVPTGRAGTEVRIELFPNIAESLTNLGEVVKARAPMLPYAMETKVISGNGTTNSLIDSRWWERASRTEIEKFLTDWDDISTSGKVLTVDERRKRSPWPNMRELQTHSRGVRSSGSLTWPGTQPDNVDETGRIIDGGTQTTPGLLFCSYGVAVGLRRIDGRFGLVELGEAKVTPDRASLQHEDPAHSQIVQRLVQGLLPRVRDEINNLGQYGAMPARIPFIKVLAERYGTSILVDSSLKWIPTLEQPGNLVHLSLKDFRDRVKSESALMVCTGMSPADAYNLSAYRTEQNVLNKELAVLLSFNEFSVDYWVERRLEVTQGSNMLKGTLDEVLDHLSEEKQKLILLEVILHSIAEAWSTNMEALKSQVWFLKAEYLKAYLWTHLKCST
jgi:hypothetical protein